MTANKSDARYDVWDGYDAGSGKAFVRAIQGWNDKLDEDVLLARPLPSKLPKLTVTNLTAGKIPDVMAVAGSPLIVSQAIRDVLVDAAGEVVQFAPIEVSEGAKAPYFVLNVLTRMPAADQEQSEFITYGDPPHEIRRIRKLVLKPMPAGQPPVFRPEELPIILVRDDLRKQLQVASKTAGIFTPLAKYKFGAF